jgi:hypothetical protein
MGIETLKPNIIVQGLELPDPVQTAVAILPGANVTPLAKRLPRVIRRGPRVCALKCADAQFHRSLRRYLMLWSDD